MNQDQWKKAKELFDAVRKCPPDERADFLDENRNSDEEFSREVESLLSFSDNGGSFLENLTIVNQLGFLFFKQSTI